MRLAQELHSLIFPRFWPNGIAFALGAVPNCPASRKKVFQKPEVLVPQGVMTIPKNLFYFPAVQGRIGRYNWISQGKPAMRTTLTQGDTNVKKHKRIDFALCDAVMMMMFGTHDWLSDGSREVQGYAIGVELCGVGIRILLTGGKKVIWRMARQNAEFITTVSLFATKENA